MFGVVQKTMQGIREGARYLFGTQGPSGFGSGKKLYCKGRRWLVVNILGLEEEESWYYDCTVSFSLHVLLLTTTTAFRTYPRLQC